MHLNKKFILYACCLCLTVKQWKMDSKKSQIVVPWNNWSGSWWEIVSPIYIVIMLGKKFAWKGWRHLSHVFVYPSNRKYNVGIYKPNPFPHKMTYFQYTNNDQSQYVSNHMLVAFRLNVKKHWRWCFYLMFILYSIKLLFIPLDDISINWVEKK